METQTVSSEPQPSKDGETDGELTGSETESIIYIEPNLVVDLRHPLIEGHWEVAHADNSRSLKEESPGWSSLEDALGWARSRAPTIFLNVRHDVTLEVTRRFMGMRLHLYTPVQRKSRTLTLTEDDVNFAQIRHLYDQDVPDLLSTVELTTQLKRSDFSGEAFLVDNRRAVQYGAVTGYTARWEAARAGIMRLVELTTWGPDSLDDAIAWARRRAPYVLVTDGPFGYEYWSAGERMFDELDVPAWGADMSAETRRTDEHAAGSALKVSESNGRQFSAGL